MNLKKYIVTQNWRGTTAIWQTKNFKQEENPDHKILATFNKDEVLSQPDPTPASAEDEAARLYPYDATLEAGTSEWGVDQELTDMQRTAHITCARMYTDTIAALKEELQRLRELYGIKYETKEQSKSASGNRIETLEKHKIPSKPNNQA